jgi:chromosomal replication initiation ATPase DnaA
MTNQEKKKRIEEYQEDYHKLTGEYIKVIQCTKWEGEANLGEPIEFWKLVQVVSDFTGWPYKKIYNKSRNEEVCFRRALIDFIAVNNDITYNFCAKATDRDHVTVMHSVSRFEDRLDVEPHTRKVFGEVIRYVRENYYIYKELNITKESFEEVA